MSSEPAVDSDDAIIRIEGVYKAFGTNVLFEDANLSVRPRETLAIIGESGSGKSILLKIMIGLVDPDRGRVLYKGRNVVEMEQEDLDRVHRDVGYVFQSDALFDSMTIADNIGYGMREHTKASDQEIRERASTCLEMVGLEQRTLDLFPAALSGGMRKRVGIARAIAIKPEVLLYDEPTQGLDPQNITRIAEMIRALGRDLESTSIVVTHDMRTAFGISDRIALLHDQRFAFVATPREFVESSEPAISEFIAEARDEIEALAASNPVLATPPPAPSPSVP